MTTQTREEYAAALRRWRRRPVRNGKRYGMIVPVSRSRWRRSSARSSLCTTSGAQAVSAEEPEIGLPGEERRNNCHREHNSRNKHDNLLRYEAGIPQSVEWMTTAVALFGLFLLDLPQNLHRIDVAENILQQIEEKSQNREEPSPKQEFGREIEALRRANNEAPDEGQDTDSDPAHLDAESIRKPLGLLRSLLRGYSHSQILPLLLERSSSLIKRPSVLRSRFHRGRAVGEDQEQSPSSSCDLLPSSWPSSWPSSSPSVLRHWNVPENVPATTSNLRETNQKGPTAQRKTPRSFHFLRPLEQQPLAVSVSGTVCAWLRSKIRRAGWFN